MIEILMIKFFFENVQIKKADDLDMALKKVNSSISAGKSLQGSRIIEIIIIKGFFKYVQIKSRCFGYGHKK